MQLYYLILDIYNNIPINTSRLLRETTGQMLGKGFLLVTCFTIVVDVRNPFIRVGNRGERFTQGIIEKSSSVSFCCLISC